MNAEVLAEVLRPKISLAAALHSRPVKPSNASTLAPLAATLPIQS